jgi:hypothetical protein
MVCQQTEVEIQAAKSGALPKSGRSEGTRLSRISGLVVILWAGLLAVVSLYRLSPPNAMSASAPATEFSSERAMSHIRLLAEKPHPIGSAENARVRDYIFQELTAQGVAPEFQETTALGMENAPSIVAGTVHNVVARLKGEGTTKAVMLSAHYDSVVNGPGASDDGSGVATLLETLRAVKAGRPLKNDVIFLFTDGEEAGLLGARAFVAEHRWVNDVGVALNFEARGTRGPVFLFETSSQNGGLIKRFGNAVEHPIASSYMSDVYKTLPNKTDLTIFKRAGLAGLNFAFINGRAFYHTGGDDIGNVDQRSLQHDGSYALSLTREFGDSDLRDIKEEDAIYFDLLGTTLVHYPARLATVVATFVVLCFVGVVVIGVRRRHLTISGLCLGFVALLSSALCAALTARIAWVLVHATSPAARAGSLSGTVTLLGLFILTIAVVSAVYYWFSRRLSIQNLTAGGLLGMVILTVVAALYLPGASHLFAWPLFFSLLPLGSLYASTRVRVGSPGMTALLSLCCIPGIVLIVPTIFALYVAIGLNVPEVLMIFLTLLIGLLIPHLSLLTVRMSRRKTFISAAGLLSMGLLASGIVIGNHEQRYAKPGRILYGLNADTGTAIWAGVDGAPVDWRRLSLVSGARSKGALSEFFPFSSSLFFNSPAPTTQLPPCIVSLVEETRTNDYRNLRLRITSPRHASYISIYTDDTAEIISASVNGKEITQIGDTLRLHYSGLPLEGIELILGFKSVQPLAIKIVDSTYSVGQNTDLRIDEGSANNISGVEADSVLVAKSYLF